MEKTDKLILDDVESKGFGLIYKLPMIDKDLDVVAKAFYAYICSFAGNGDTAFPSVEKICYDLGVSKQRLIRHRKALVEKGYITVTQIKENGKFKHNVYRLNKKLKSVNEEPCLQNEYTEKPSTQKPCTQNAYTENSPSNINNLNKNNLNNNKDNKNIYKENDIAEQFEKFWKEYPRKIEKQPAFNAFKKAIKESKFEIILEGVIKFKKYHEIKKTEKDYIKYPATFLNQKLFKEDYEIQNKKQYKQQPKTHTNEQYMYSNDMKDDGLPF